MNRPVLTCEAGVAWQPGGMEGRWFVTIVDLHRRARIEFVLGRPELGGTARATEHDRATYEALPSARRITLSRVATDAIRDAAGVRAGAR